MNTETPTTETATAPAVEIPGETIGDVLDLAEILRIHCDDPRGIRAEPWHGNLRHLGNAAWAVVDALDRLRDEADALHAAMLETLP